MANQYFPTIEDFLQAIRADLPEGVYAEDLADAADPADRSYSSSELRAAASVLAGLASNLSDVAADKSISTATPSGLTRWEQDFFKSTQDASLTVEARRQNLLAKYRSSGGISLPALRNVVAGILDPLGLEFDLIPWSGQSMPDGRTGAWILGASALATGTYLSMLDPIMGNRSEGSLVPLDDNLDYQAAGLTLEQLEQIQVTAYTYEIAIYGNAASATLTTLDKQLSAYEPARSAHLIRNNASRPVDPDTVQPGPYLANDIPWRA